MTTEVLKSERPEMTELSLDDLDQVSGGHTNSHNDGLFYGLLAGGIAIAAALIIFGA